MAAYGDDLAYIHHAGFSELAATAATRIHEILLASGIESGLVVELGCGSGVTARRLTDTGYDVLGIDSSEPLIAIARRNAPSARFKVGSFASEPLPDCDAVVAVGEVFNYLFDSAYTGDSLAGVFRRVHRALRPGGVFVFDLAGPGRIRGGGPIRDWTAASDWAVLVEAREDRESLVLTRHITTFRRSGALYRRGEELHRQRLYRPLEVLGLLRAGGFRARSLRGYGPARFAAGHRVFVARRRGARRRPSAPRAG